MSDADLIATRVTAAHAADLCPERADSAQYHLDEAVFHLRQAAQLVDAAAEVEQ